MENINSGNTLDIRPTPGQDIRFAATAADSIFSFGNFRIDRDRGIDFINNTGNTLSFSSYYNISNSDANNFNVLKIINTKDNELNLKKDDPNSYVYFGSFYTKVANSINKIIDNFPYAILSKSINSGITIFDYSKNVIEKTSSFKIALSSITNQGDIIYVSGATETPENTPDLFYNFDKYEIQLSGNSQNPTTAATFHNEIHKILEYNYSINNYLEFKIKGYLLPLENSISNFNYPLYIRPSRKRYGEFKRTISSLESHLLRDGTFLIPDSDTDTLERIKFSWPKIIDGFAPDSFGQDFNNYTTSLLNAARSVDEDKTNIMFRTMLPENFIDLDSENKIYRKLTTVYGEQFDKIKQYIDGLAYAHSISYKSEESVPNKFIVRLANLLGAKLPNAFRSEDIIDYLSGEFDENGSSFEEYNLDLWRRMLSNIVWLYKKKGTRDAISFIFRLLGAPDCLFNLEEFIYEAKKVVSVEASQNFTPSTLDPSEEESLEFSDGFQEIIENDEEINNTLDDYPEINSQIFQLGGLGRGNGQEFIDNLGEEYDLVKKNDDLKIREGSNRNIVNTKEINIDLRPSRAIECDVKSWYELGYGWWNWGSLSPIYFSGLTVPFEWQVENINTITPPNMSALTINEWLEYIYLSNVNPKNRKTLNWQNGTTDTYMNLKKIYITYMLWTNNQNSNRLTFKKLEKFLNLLERNFQDLVPFFVPSTTIFNTYGTVYGNSEFNRHRFVYKPGINDGSEFKIELPLVVEEDINTVNFSVKLSPKINPNIDLSNFSVRKSPNIQENINSSTFIVRPKKSTQLNTNLANINSSVFLEDNQIYPVPPILNLTPIIYPE
jgi:hypothetical protein